MTVWDDVIAVRSLRREYRNVCREWNRRRVLVPVIVDDVFFRCASNAVMVLENAEISSRCDQLVEETLGWKSTGGLLLKHSDMRHGEEYLASSRTIRSVARCDSMPRARIPEIRFHDSIHSFEELS